VKLATYRAADSAGLRFGALVGDRLLDIERAGGPRSLKRAIELGLDRLGHTIAWASAPERSAAERAALFLDPAAVHFAPPIPDPEKFLCVGKNYQAHLQELVRTDLIREMPNEPTGFIKLNAVMTGHDAEVARPEGIAELDYEPELAFVIGKPAYRVPESEAMQYVAGITAFNDLTAREIQRREVASGSRFWTAKNMPGFGPIGPWIVTLDEIADVNDLWLTCHVNGARRLRFNTRDMINKLPRIIAHFSRFMPLQPGDLFATAAPGGIAAGQDNPGDLFLKPGDVVDVGIEGHLSLRTRIV